MYTCAHPKSNLLRGTRTQPRSATFFSLASMPWKAHPHSVGTSTKLYTPKGSYIYVDKSNGIGRVGITKLEKLNIGGNVANVELPRLGSAIRKGEKLATGKIITGFLRYPHEVFAPMSGEVIAVNGNLEVQPDLLKDMGSSEEETWVADLKLSDLRECRDLLSYQEYLNQTIEDTKLSISIAEEHLNTKSTVFLLQQADYLKQLLGEAESEKEQNMKS